MLMSVCILSPISQVYRSLHQTACWERRAAGGRGEEKHRPSSGGNRQQDVPALPGRSQVQTGHRHRAGDQTPGHL